MIELAAAVLIHSIAFFVVVLGLCVAMCVYHDLQRDKER